nr:sugar transferase [uncultured Duncaniella sp.]
MKYDILYLRNMSLSLDLRIIYHTLFTVIRGEGK